MPSPYPNRQSFCPDRSDLRGIIPTELCQKRATASLSRCVMDPEHLLYDRLLFTPTTQQQYRCTLFYLLRSLELLKVLDKSNTTASFWTDHKWNTEWKKNIFASTHLFLLLVSHHRKWPYLGIGIGTHLFVKAPRPGDSEVTFWVFELSCHLLLPA